MSDKTTQSGLGQGLLAPRAGWRCPTDCMNTLQKAAVSLIAVASVGLITLESTHFYRYGHFVGPALHADVIVGKGDIGIEGISKLYEAKLTNYAPFPVKVKACDFISDASAPGTMVAYAVERWDRQLGKWAKVVEWDESLFCRPYPLGIAQAHLISKWLWPGQSISTGEEATAARRGFDLGDSARFSVFYGAAGDWKFSLPTGAFRIDELPKFEELPLRVRH
jgi:hypothetical protein